MKHRLVLAVGTAAVLIAALLPSAVVAASPDRTARPARFDVGGRAVDLSKLPSHMDPDRVIMLGVELQGRPVASYVGAAEAAGRTFSETQKADVRAVLGRQQAEAAIKLRTLGAQIDSSFTDVFNGFRIQIAAGKLPALAAMSGVTRIYSVPIVQPDLKNTDGYLGADKTWGQTGFTGAGVKIAVIDTGINYYHRDFGGAGLAAWNADDPTIVEAGTFPTAKVIKGYDLVGDDYNPSDTQTSNDVPDPDPDPLDCKDPLAESVQHGSHTAGIAAGMGDTPAGNTYTGPYNASTLSTPFRIYPGVAPQAKIMSYRVFGCAGGTLVLADAIERAVRDGADVINMSHRFHLRQSRLAGCRRVEQRGAGRCDGRQLGRQRGPVRVRRRLARRGYTRDRGRGDGCRTDLPRRVDRHAHRREHHRDQRERWPLAGHRHAPPVRRRPIDHRGPQHRSGQRGPRLR